MLLLKPIIYTTFVREISLIIVTEEEDLAKFDSNFPLDGCKWTECFIHKTVVDDECNKHMKIEEDHLQQASGTNCF